MAAANSEAQSLRESLGVRAAYISWIVRGFPPPILRTWIQKSTLLLQNRGHAEVLKKTPSSAKYMYLFAPPPPPPPPRKYSRDRSYNMHSISIQVFGLLSYQTIECLGTVITKYSSNVSADVFQSIKHFSALMLGLGHCMTTCRKYSII